MIEKEFDNKVKKIATDLCTVLEFVTAIIVLIGVVIALIGMLPEIEGFWQTRSNTEGFLVFLEKASFIVVGIEFMKMLCRPSSDNVLETIIFLVARHMIVTSNSTPVEDLISTISIVLLCLIRRYLTVSKHKDTFFSGMFNRKKTEDAIVEQGDNQEE